MAKQRKRLLPSAFDNSTSHIYDIKESILFEETIKGNLTNPHRLTISATNLTNVDNSPLGIYPNPVKNYLSISGDISQIEKIRILNITGETVWGVDTIVTGENLNVSHLTSGTYLIVIQTSRGNHFYKFIKS